MARGSLTGLASSQLSASGADCYNRMRSGVTGWEGSVVNRCKECGTAAASSEFCLSCGAQLVGKSATDAIPTGVSPSVGDSPEKDRTSSSEASAGKSSRLLLTAVVGALALAGGFMVAQSLLSKSDGQRTGAALVPTASASVAPVGEAPSAAQSEPVQPTAPAAAVDLDGVYSGTIKDGTRWYVYIRDFNGTSFVGTNDIYWPRSPQGFKTNFTGTYDPTTQRITMDEDRNAQGSGQFVGQVFAGGGSMSGTWTLYSGGTSFTWNLVRE